MSFNESLVDPKTLDDIGRDLSTMYVICYVTKSGESSIYIFKADTSATFQPFNHCKFSPVQCVNPHSRPKTNTTPVHRAPSACRFRWFHCFDLRSPHHFRGRGSPIHHFGNVHRLRSYYRYNTSGRNCGALVSCFLRNDSALALTCVSKLYTCSCL